MYTNDDGIDVKEYYDNYQWSLDSHRVITDIVNYDFKNFSSLTVTFRLRRKPAFYFMYFIFPELLLALLQTLSHTLPVEHPGRMAMLTALFIGTSVTHAGIATHIPKSSDTMSLLQVYMTIMSVNLVFALLLTFVMLYTVLRYPKCQPSFVKMMVVFFSIVWPEQEPPDDILLVSMNKRFGKKPSFRFELSKKLWKPRKNKCMNSHEVEESSSMCKNSESITSFNSQDISEMETPIYEFRDTFDEIWTPNPKYPCVDLLSNYRAGNYTLQNGLDSGYSRTSGSVGTYISGKSCDSNGFVSDSTSCSMCHGRNPSMLRKRSSFNNRRSYGARRQSILAAPDRSASIRRQITQNSYTHNPNPYSYSHHTHKRPGGHSDEMESEEMLKNQWLTYCVALDKSIMYVNGFANVIVPAILFVVIPYMHDNSHDPNSED